MHMWNSWFALMSQKVEEELAGFNSDSQWNPDPPRGQDAQSSSVSLFHFTP